MYSTVFTESGVKHHQVKQTNCTFYNHTLVNSLLPIITEYCFSWCDRLWYNKISIIKLLNLPYRLSCFDRLVWYNKSTFLHLSCMLNCFGEIKVPWKQLIGPYLQKLQREACTYSAVGIKVVRILVFQWSILFLQWRSNGTYIANYENIARPLDRNNQTAMI